jgi:hypothetical protein
MAKPMGERLKKCDADQVKESMAEGLGEALQRAGDQPTDRCV